MFYSKKRYSRLRRKSYKPYGRGYVVRSSAASATGSVSSSGSSVSGQVRVPDGTVVWRDGVQYIMDNGVWYKYSF